VDFALFILANLLPEYESQPNEGGGMPRVGTLRL
jgi:hypothetical protein